MAGFMCDFLFARFFPKKPYAFFLWLTMFAAFLFPVTLVSLPPLVSTFLIGMITWGIYYELLQFSHFNFIASFIPKSHYPLAWGTLNSFRAIAYLLGPLISGPLLILGFKGVFSIPLVLYSFSAIGLAILAISVKKITIQPENESKVSLFSQINTWKSLFVRVWPVYVFLFLISCIDSAFWTVGTLISEDLRQASALGSFFLPAYSFPAIFIWLMISLFPSTGKKRLAFITGSLGGLILATVGLSSNLFLILSSVFLASCFLSISYPEIEAVFEDYVTRLGHSGTSMVGLQATAISSSYIIGPILAGSIAQFYGNRAVFSVLGIAVAVYSLFAFFLVPKKIAFPASV